MTAKEYLASISRLESFIASKKQKVEALKCMAANVSPSPITDMPKAPSKTISPITVYKGCSYIFHHGLCNRSGTTKF